MRLVFQVGLLALQAARAVNGAVPSEWPSEYIFDSTANATQLGSSPGYLVEQLSTLELRKDAIKRRVRETETWAEDEKGDDARGGGGESRVLFRWLGWWRRKKTGEGRRKSTGPLKARLEEGTTSAGGDPTLSWKGAGGSFGLSADWREALLEPEGGGLRGNTCMTREKQADVRAILERRKATNETQRVAACVRTKDFARFLPEWIAFHYALGVDEITVYDDDSTDNTRDVLRPFIRAGFVRYKFEVIKDRSAQMKPLNHCLEEHVLRRGQGKRGAASWVLFHDTDEYLYPTNTSLTIREALEQHRSTCCVLVGRVQYGSSGYEEMPRGLMLENFVMHAEPGAMNGIAKVMVNLDPSEPEKGVVVPRLASMHNARGCVCDGQLTNGVSGMRINHYLGSIGDYMDRTTRYWEEKRTGEMAAAKTVLQRDMNDNRSEDIRHWECATREVLFRISHGLLLE